MDADRLKVIVVGSGIVGLTAARILQEHHSVTVYERGSDSVATGGQGIMISSNGVKVLESIDFDRKRAGAVSIHGMRTFADGKLQDDFEIAFKSRFGQETLTMKRSDLRDELLRHVKNQDGYEDAVKIFFGNKVTGLDCDKGIVQLADGTIDSADAVIVADGVHSRLRNEILQTDAYAAKKTGLTCYRILVSTEDAKKALDDLPLPYWWNPSTSANRVCVFHTTDGSPRFIIAYPIRNQTLFTLSCIMRTTVSNKPEVDSWFADGDKQTMLDNFPDFGEDIKRILSAATEVKVWELQDLETLPTWVRGRAIVIGDAAHAMTPLQGQGANMGIEDAEALHLFGPEVKRGDVPAILEKIGTFRRKRVDKVLGETRKTHGSFGMARKFQENAELYYSYNGIVAAMAEEQQWV